MARDLSALTLVVNPNRLLRLPRGGPLSASRNLYRYSSRRKAAEGAGSRGENASVRDQMVIFWDHFLLFLVREWNSLNCFRVNLMQPLRWLRDRLFLRILQERVEWNHQQENLGRRVKSLWNS